MAKSPRLSADPSLTLRSLSEDLLLRVLDKVSEPTDRKSWRLVCREFHKVETVSRKRKAVFRRDELADLARRHPWLEQLDLSACPRLVGHELSGLARGLRVLDLRRVSGLSLAGLEGLVEGCPLLEEVDVSYWLGFGDLEASVVARLKKLRRLRMVKCLGVTDIGVARIAVGCGERLEELGLKWCMEVTDLGIDLVAAKCRGLRSLDISYLKVTNDGLASVSALKKLEVLSMVRCFYVDDDGLASLGKGCDSLLRIDVSRCDNVTSSGLISIMRGHQNLQHLNAAHILPELTSPLLSKIKNLRSLSTFDIDGCEIYASILCSIGLSLKNLVELSLSKCPGVTDQGIIELLNGCNSLRSLDLTCCHQITDVAILAIGTSCRDLICLKLESCDLISDMGLQELGSGCPSLSELDLTDCFNINDSGLKYVSQCSHLRSLKLGLCLNLSNKGLVHIGTGCKELQELDLYRCIRIGDDGLAAIADGCTKLRTLNLSYCYQLTDEGMKHVGRLEELSTLEMRSLLKVTCIGMSSIAWGCKKLVELDVKRCYSIDDKGLLALAQHSKYLRQINISYCPVSDMGLFALIAKLRCLQDVKIIHALNVSVEGLEFALRSSESLKKVKALESLKYLLSRDLIKLMHSRGMRFRWINKHLD
ncbi:hypothetical protein AMTRI_Chr02g220560 [Amborella trichopoda]|uniref:F-box/LRR-repeat protein 15-like leucin rich repeat domain-containing protein n=1 Tax=Amborella trichopoda TaxID=13333 RepID=W1P029_AMBTC|nr:F-box/LRR-repeat protein 3 [Amborella trichopoda]ERN03177.1 hypothetical protein AMTR_s00003p00132120 [Amborella trichopoda]|eukprot:XP_006841502.1 F-box/LRR-repeat protein 3 [Amborella trichopoda]